MWPLGGQPHDMSALALLRVMQDHFRYLNTLGTFAAAQKVSTYSRQQMLDNSDQQLRSVRTL